MAYLDRGKTKYSAGSIIAVTVFEAVIILGVVKGLTTNFVRHDKGPIIRATDVPIAKPPPQPVEPPKKRKEHDPVAKATDTVTAAPNPFATATPGTFPLATPTPLATETVAIRADPTPTPTPTPSYTARSPTPRGKPGEWATANDYPARDLREGNQGVTKFRLTVGADGRVQDCTITASSGFPSLDAATCARVSARARFEPATDASGAKVSGTYANAIRWEIPE
jgi:periplasmic protein TonB